MTENGAGRDAARNTPIPREGLESPCCEYLHAHPQRVQAVLRAMPGEDEIARMSELFKVLGDGTRMRILLVLLEGEMCVCDLAQLLGATISAVSHQLRILRQARLVSCRRAGKTVFYLLADEHVRALVSQGLEHVRE